MPRQQTPNLSIARALRRDSVASWNRDVVWLQLTELNALHDILRAPGRDEAERADAVARARERLQVAIVAAAWSRDLFVHETWQFTRTELEREEDAFAPAALLLGLEARGAEIATWLQRLPDEVKQTLADVGLL